VILAGRNQNLFIYVVALCFLGAHAQEAPPAAPPKTEEAAVPGLEVIAAGAFNVTESFNNGVTAVSPVFGIGATQQLGPRVKFDVVLDLAPAFGYVIMQNSEWTKERFSAEGLVDQISFTLDLNPNTALQFGKVRFRPDHQLNPLPLGVDPESRAKNVFPVYGATYTISSDDKREHIQFFVGESRDGQLDLHLESEGIALGMALKKKIAEQLDLYANSYFSEAPGDKNYARQNLGLAWDSQKRLSAYTAGTYFNNSPYHLPERNWGAEGGVSCRIDEKSSFGTTAVCTFDEQQAYFGYYKRQISPGFNLTGFVGYRSYDRDFRRVTGARDSAEIGFSVEFFERLTPYFNWFR
jgi:hypothetical protein